MDLVLVPSIYQQGKGPVSKGQRLRLLDLQMDFQFEEFYIF